MGAYTGPPFSCGKTQYLMYLLIQFWAEKKFRNFLKFLPLNPKGIRFLKSASLHRPSLNKKGGDSRGFEMASFSKMARFFDSTDIASKMVINEFKCSLESVI